MEIYSGTKFTTRFLSAEEPPPSAVQDLHTWAWLLGELGLTPLHDAGAFGNMSCRNEDGGFLITRTGMTPSRHLVPGNFVNVLAFSAESGTFSVAGVAEPSSESIMHHALYAAYPEIRAILHGHSQLFCDLATELNIPVSHAACAYGTQALAESAVETAKNSVRFFILRDHGFVSMGTTLADAGQRLLNRYAQLLKLLVTPAAWPHLQD